jgi:signal transduction histidine kinase
VWILDDSPLEASIVADALKPDFEIETFTDGTTLIERLNAGANPDVLVLDWHNQGLSGREVLAFVRSTRNEASLPVLMLTAMQVDATDSVDALQAGANDFVTKPFVPEVLRARVATLLRVRALHERVLQAEAEGHARRAFEEQLIGIVSHDLRNPLSAVIFAAEVLRSRPGLDERQTKAVERIVTSCGRAVRMIEDLLDFSRVRLGGGLALTTAPVDLHVLAARVVEELLVTRPGRRVALEAVGDGAGIWDADRLAQVVQNLVGNALQHTTEDVGVRVRTSGEGSHVVLTVHNDGPTIAAEDLERLFQPFQQGRGAHPIGRSVGLGLYITAHIVEAHGGFVDVQSSADTGTTFRVVLPRDSGATTQALTGAER